MNVALVLERMDPSLGGRESYTAQVAASLAARGLGVTVICQTARWTCPGVRIVELGSHGLMRHARLSRFVSDARREIERGQVDIVHAMFPLGGADIYQPHGGTAPAQYRANLRRRRGLRRMATWAFRELNFRRCLNARLERDIADDTGVCCLCVSPMVAREFEQHYRRTENVRVIFNGVEVPACDEATRLQWRRQRRDELGIGPDDPVFLAVATNLELKGVPQAIEAFARCLVQPECRNGQLVVVGSKRREAIARCERLADRCGVTDRVHLFGPTPDIFQWYAAADALVQLSWYDSCGLTILEAMRWSIPALSTAQAGASSLLEKGAGITVDWPDDIESVTAAMAQLADPARRQEYADVCDQLAGDLTMARHVDQLVELYEELAGR